MTAALLEFVTLFPAAVALSWIVFACLYTVRHEWRLPLDPDFSPSVVVVVPAMDEELVIESALEALLEQDYASLAIHVVSDGSTDRTAELARRFEARGVTVHELVANVGKSAALQHVLDQVEGDLFLVVDADTRCRPDAVRMIVQQFADPAVGAVTGHARVRGTRRPLTAMQALEYSVIVGLAKRAEQVWGGLYTVSGAAACFRLAALRDAGGWSGATVTGDIEVSWRLQRRGWRLAYEPRALFSIQAPRRLRALYRQRLRWSRGMVEVLRLHWNIADTTNRALIPIAAQVVGAALWMVTATAFLAVGVAGALDGSVELPELGSGRSSAFLWTFGLFGLQALVATVLDGAHAAGGWRVLPLAVVFPLYFWIVVFPSFVAGGIRGAIPAGSARWTRTERSA